MSSKILQSLYDHSPRIVQTCMLNMHALNIHRERYGRRFQEILEQLTCTQYFSTQQIAEYQSARLRELVQHAYDTVPYYHEAFNKARLKPTDVISCEDLPKIPILTRDDLRKHRDRLVSRTSQRRRLVVGHTSGTTGSPLTVYWDANTCRYTNAVDWRQKGWANIFPGDRIAVVLGRPIVPVHQTKPPFWRLNYVHKQLWLSAFHMTEANLPYYVDKLRSYAPHAIEGYPSTVFILARYLVSRNITLPLKAAFTSAETLLPFQRETIERAFQCRLFDFYGMAERVLFATECEAHSGRHLNFEYGLTEIIDASNYPVGIGQRGVIVSTSLQNFAMPLIRYKTSDVSELKREKCTCGRDMPRIEDITTKAEDIVITPDGRMISSSALTHPFKPLDNIEKSQIVQQSLTSITVKIVPRPGYSSHDSELLLQGLRERLGDAIEIVVDIVDDIPRTDSGKYRWVISKVAPEFFTNTHSPLHREKGPPQPNAAQS